MTALRKILIEEETVFTAPVARVPATKLYVVANSAPAEVVAAQAEGNALKNILLFFAAPFIGLVYIVAFPIVGLVALAVLAGVSPPNTMRSKPPPASSRLRPSWLRRLRSASPTSSSSRLSASPRWPGSVAKQRWPGIKCEWPTEPSLKGKAVSRGHDPPAFFICLEDKSYEAQRRLYGENMRPDHQVSI